MIEDEQLELFPESTKYIYESPDGGQTLYRREVGSGKKRKLDLMG